MGNGCKVAPLPPDIADMLTGDGHDAQVERTGPIDGTGPHKRVLGLMREYVRVTQWRVLGHTHELFS